MKNLNDFKKAYIRSLATLSGTVLAGAACGYVLINDCGTALAVVIPLGYMLTDAVLRTSKKRKSYIRCKKNLLKKVFDISLRSTVSEMDVSIKQYENSTQKLPDKINIAKSVENIDPARNPILWRRALLEQAASTTHIIEDMSEFTNFTLKTFDNTQDGRAKDIANLITENPGLAQLLKKEIRNDAKIQYPLGRGYDNAIHYNVVMTALVLSKTK